jgi:hypothetical protein
MQRLNILIGGEFTRTIAAEFERLGHYVLTADFNEPTRPGPHYLGNWWDVVDKPWDLRIFHPTCRWMANSGSKHVYIGGDKANGVDTERWVKMAQEAWELWRLVEFCKATNRPAAFENPVMLGYAKMMSELDKLPQQVVQPWWFGTDENGPDNVKKATCWWTLGGLPKLRRTGILDGSTAREEVWKMAPTVDPEERRMARSAFTPGHAKAIAEQWGSAAMEMKYGLHAATA